MERMLELAKKRGIQAEIIHLTQDVTPVSFEDNQLQAIQTQRTVDVGLRVIHHGRVGVAASSDLSNPEGLLERALAASRDGMIANFDFPGPDSPAALVTEDPDLAGVDAEALIAEGKRQHVVLRAGLGEGPAIVSKLVKAHSTYRIANTSGVDYTQRLSSCNQRLMAALPGSGSGPYAEQESLGFASMGAEKLDSVIRQHEWAKNSSSPGSGKKQILLAPSCLYALLWRVTTAISARSLLDGVSVLDGGVDQKVLDERLTIWDRPHFSGHPAMRAFDDEGVVTADRKLFDRGVFTGFIHNLDTAAQMKGVRPTGNGYKAARWESGMRVPPTPQPAHVTIEPGDTPHEELIRSMKDGVVLYSVLGAHSGNIPAGQLSVSVGIGFHVLNGEVVGRAVDTMVSGNVWEMLTRLAAISSDCSDSGLPYLLLDGVDVTG